MNLKRRSLKRVLFTSIVSLAAIVGIWFVAVFVATWRIQSLAERYKLVIDRNFDGELKLGNWIGLGSQHGFPTVVALSTNRADVLHSCCRSYPSIRKLVITGMGDETIPEIESLKSLDVLWLTEFDLSDPLLTMLLHRRWQGVILDQPRSIQMTALESLNQLNVQELLILDQDAQDNWTVRIRLPTTLEHLDLLVEPLPVHLSDDLAKMNRLKGLSIVTRDGSQIRGELLLSCPSTYLRQIFLTGPKITADQFNAAKFEERRIALTINGAMLKAH